MIFQTISNGFRWLKTVVIETFTTKLPETHPIGELQTHLDVEHPQAPSPAYTSYVMGLRRVGRVLIHPFVSLSARISTPPGHTEGSMGASHHLEPINSGNPDDLEANQPQAPAMDVGRPRIGMFIAHHHPMILFSPMLNQSHPFRPSKNGPAVRSTFLA